MSHTPTKRKSTTLLSNNNTPIIVAKNNMSKSSFVKLKNSLKMPNSGANCKPEHTSTTSNSVNVDRNIQVIKSRRDTYPTDYEQIVFEQNTTPVPRRSILKSSNSDKPFRSKSSGRKVRFAPLPESDSRIEIFKDRFNSRLSIVTDDKINETDVIQDSKKDMQIDGEVYDDDLDGVQPLDCSDLNIKESKRAVTGTKKQNPIKSKKNENDFAKIKRVIEKSEKITLSPKARITRSNITLAETNSPNLNNINKTVSFIETKSTKVSKAVQTKKSNKKALSKRVVSFKSIKTNSNDFSRYKNSTSEVEKSTKQLICIPPMTKKNKFMKKEKDIEDDNNSLTKKRVKKEKNGETASNVSSYLNTRGRKRTADTSIDNGPKINISSKVMANSSQENSSPGTKRTRNMSKLTAKVPDNQLPEIENVGQVKIPKSIQKPNEKKRVLKFEALSNDSGQPARKKPRRATEENKETEMKINSFTRNASKNKILSTDTIERLKKNEVKKSTLHLPKKITRNTRQSALETTEIFPSPRVLRLRDKKK